MLFRVSVHESSPAIARMAIAILIATHTAPTQAGDAINLTRQTWNHLRSVGAELAGQDAVDDQGNILGVRIIRPNGERLEKLTIVCPRLEMVCISGQDGRLTGNNLRCLQSLSRLKRLWLVLPLTDDSAEAISQLRQLQELRIVVMQSGLTEHGLEMLSQLQNVTSLGLQVGYNEFQATEAQCGISVLRQFPRLKDLELSGASISGRTLQAVGDLRGLAGFHLTANTRMVQSDDYRSLRHLKQVKRVTLPAMAAPYISSLDTLVRIDGMNGITDDEMMYLSTLINLEELGLHEAEITDQSLVSLKNLTSLRTLNIHARNITGSGFVHLDSLNNLRRLILRHTQFHPENVHYLVALSSLEELDFGSTPVSRGENWKSLAKLNGLSRLKEVQVDLNESNRLQLANMLPGVSVTFLE